MRASPRRDQARPQVGRRPRPCARLSMNAARINSSIERPISDEMEESCNSERDRRSEYDQNPPRVGSKIGNPRDLGSTLPPRQYTSSWRSEVSPGNKTAVISGREAPRRRNTTPSPYPAHCGAGSMDGQSGGNALGRACSLTCRNSRRNHTAGTSEGPATSLQAPRISHTPRIPDRCPIERGAHGNTVWSETARSTSAAKIR
jgi:hypothetical protein